MSFKEQKEQQGGFVKFVKSERRTRGGGGSNRRKASQNGQPKVFKTYADRVAEEEAAHKRWAGIPSIVTAREMIAEANLSEEATAELTATISRLNPDQLEEMVNSGKLAEVLCELKD